MASYTINQWGFQNSSHCRKHDINEALISMRYDSKHSDLSFICKGTENKGLKKTINAHQVLFSSVSKFFKELFEIAHEKQSHERVLITLDSVDPTIMEKLIDCIYGGSTNVTNENKAQLMILCRSLQLDIEFEPFIEPSFDGRVAAQQENEMPFWSEVNHKPFNPDWQVQGGSPLEAFTYVICKEDNFQKAISHGTCDFYSTSNEYTIPEKRIKATNTKEPQSSKSHHCQPKAFVCDHCPYSTDKKSILNAHVNGAHLKIINRKYNVCKCKGINNSHLDNHISNVLQCSENYHCKNGIHDINIKKEMCDTYPTISNVCTKQEQINKTMPKIQKFSTELGKCKTFICERCPFTTAVKETLKYHIDAVHLKIKENKCNFCEFRTFKRWNLQRHINARHLVRTTYKCVDCQYETGILCNLYKHQRTRHTCS